MSFEPIESNELKQLARDAQLATPEFSTDELLSFFFDALAKEGRKMRAHFTIAMEALSNWPEIIEDAQLLYAQSLGVAELTDEQKKQALLNHILGEGE